MIPVKDPRFVLGEVVIDAIHQDVRIDAAAMTCLDLPSRNRARKEIKGGRLLLDGLQVETSRRVQPGQRLTLFAPPEPPPVYARDIEIVWADPHFAVVMKPPGLVVSGNRSMTLERALPYNLPPTEADDPLPWPRPVHRLDARTSGLVLVARSLRAQVELGRALQERRITKRYRALVSGRLEGRGVVDHPIDGRDARSRWVALGHTRSLHTGWMTAVDLWPETGRTHQLRIHCARLGHPILGDGRYGPDKILRSAGLFLTAVALELAHPITAEPLLITVDPPAKFATFPAREGKRWERFVAETGAEPNTR